MKRTLVAWCVITALLLEVGILAQSTGETIDWVKAKELFQKEQRGQSLSDEESDYLTKAKEARRAGGGARAVRVSDGAGGQRPAPESLTPLTDLKEGDRYEGEVGGLYGKGSNEPSSELKAAAAAALAKIKPLDSEGKPDETGKIVLVSISMSNATQEFSVFKRIADVDERKSEKLTIVDGAQGGQAMAEWVPEDGRPWREAMSRLERAGVTPAQVQVAWVKLANKSPRGSFKEHLGKLEADTTKVLQNAKRRFPNLHIVYLGSRIWAGNAQGALNPEPYAYEGAFAVRNLIQRQSEGEAALGFDKVPVLLWGPYLWAAGEAGRETDDLAYFKTDFAADGVHPSQSGREKVAKQLLEFFATHSLAKGWFHRAP